MALKKKISADDYAKLSDVFKAEYVKDGDNYKLDVEGDDDPAELKRALDHEKAEKKRIAKERDDAKKALEDKDEDAIKKSGDVKALQDSFDKKLADQKREADEAVAKMRLKIENDRKSSVATSLAAKISKSPKLMERVIRDRIAVEFDDAGDPIVRVLDDAGKPTVATIADLEKELVANKDFADIIIASKASGGGGGATQPGSASQGGGGATSSHSSENLAKIPAGDLRDRIKARKQTGG